MSPERGNGSFVSYPEFARLESQVDRHEDALDKLLSLPDTVVRLEKQIDRLTVIADRIEGELRQTAEQRAKGFARLEHVEKVTEKLETAEEEAQRKHAEELEAAGREVRSGRAAFARQVATHVLAALLAILTAWATGRLGSGKKDHPEPPKLEGHP